jgi:hypothetical protein
MPYTLAATAVPLPTAPSTFINPASGTPTVSPALVAGDTTALLTKFNCVAATLDAHGRAGGGAYAITNGLGISAAAGLHLTVASGQATIDQVVTIASNQDVVLPDNTARVYVWLSQLGAISLVSNSLTAPGATYVFLGSAVTAAAAISSVDSSGVMKLCGGTLCRQTADVAGTPPGDSPPASVSFFNRGASNAMWFWDGTGYTDVNAGLATSAVILAPTTSARNVVQGSTDSVIPLSTKAHSATQSGDLFEALDSSANVLALVSSIGAGSFRPRDAVTNAATTALTLDHFSSGTPAAGYGSGIAFNLQSSTTNSRAAALQAVSWVTATDASRAARWALSVYDTAAREAIRAEASGTAALLGFFGASAVAQQANTASARGALQALGLIASGGFTKSDTGTLATQTTSVTVANTGTETSLVGTVVGSVTLPANSLIVGTTIRLRASGYFTTKVVPGTIEVKLKLGSATILDTGAQTVLGSITGQYWSFETDITCRTTGAGGTVMGQGFFSYASGAIGAAQGEDAINTSAVTLDTTASNLVDLRFQWGTADAGNTITCSNLTVECLA